MLTSTKPNRHKSDTGAAIRSAPATSRSLPPAQSPRCVLLQELRNRFYGCRCRVCEALFTRKTRRRSSCWRHEMPVRFSASPRGFSRYPLPWQPNRSQREKTLSKINAKNRHTPVEGTALSPVPRPIRSTSETGPSFEAPPGADQARQRSRSTHRRLSIPWSADDRSGCRGLGPSRRRGRGMTKLCSHCRISRCRNGRAGFGCRRSKRTSST